MVPLFALTSFWTAMLLFLVQPLVGRMVLPAFGGSPHVWTTAMLFFQTALLVGYAYTHVATTWLTRRNHLGIHLILLALPVVALPIALDIAPSGRGGPWPGLELLGALVLGVAGPFVLVASSGPLVQRWFSWTDNPAGKDPYFLFAAGNLGSAVGLIGYPVLVEPYLTIADQSRVWMYGYGVAVCLLVACATTALRRSNRVPNPASTGVPSNQRTDPPVGGSLVTVGLRRSVRWILLALIPSSLMLGVTALISTDIAAVPMLWILPLGLYLLTFTVAFSRFGPAALRGARVVAVPIVLLAVVSDTDLFGLGTAVVIQLALVTVGGLIGHGLIASERPPTTHLTQFYLLIATGGALGGLANGIVAPILFPIVLEHALVASALLFMIALWVEPGRLLTNGWPRINESLGLACVAVVGVFSYVYPRLAGTAAFHIRVLAVVAVMLVLLMPQARRGIVAVAVLGAALVPSMWMLADATYIERSFFGVHRVEVLGGWVELHHGTTVHGAQDRRSIQRSREPRAYYDRSGPMGPLMQVHDGGDLAVIGLGAGGLAAYGRAGQSMTFYEIDPAVVDIAETWFTYLDDTDASVEVVLGDGRLQVSEVSDRYEMLIADAFSSDSIPIHLVTLEALEIYLDAVVDDGSVVLNISNRHLDLEPVLKGASETLEVPALLGRGRGADGYESVWVILSQDEARLTELQAFGWRELKGPSLTWTDQRASLLSVIDP